MHYTAFVPYSVTAGCSLTWQHSRSTACALLSDHGYLLIQAFFQALQSYSWGFALIQSLSEQQVCDAGPAVETELSLPVVRSLLAVVDAKMQARPFKQAGG